jgi:tetratricopeptide (TPR) repeat protein
MQRKKILLGCWISLVFGSSLVNAKVTEEEIKGAYERSYQHEGLQNYTQAIKALSLVYTHYPDAYTINLRLGYLYIQQRLYANAEKHYQTAIQAMPNALSPRLGLLSIAIGQQNFKQAEQLGFQLLKRDVYNYYGNLKLTYVLIQLEKLEAARKLLNKMLALYPENVLFLEQLAGLFVVEKNTIKATEFYSTILILDPENIRANYYFSMTP